MTAMALQLTRLTSNIAIATGRLESSVWVRRKIVLLLLLYVQVSMSVFVSFMTELLNGPPPIRLVDGTTSHDGRVEIYIQVGSSLFVSLL